VKGLLSSRRRRRKAGWLAGTLLLVGGLTFVGFHWSNTGSGSESHFTNEPVQTVPPAPDSVAFTGKARDDVRRVAARFVATAVVRRHLDDSWDLVTPAMRKGYTRSSWDRGTIPVVPYPAEAVGLVKSRLDYSYAGRVGLRVAIFPKAGAKVRAQTFEIELQDLGRPASPHWLVSYWAPVGGQGVPSVPSDPNSEPLPYSPPRSIGAIWLIVPIALVLGSIVSLLLVLVVRGWVRRTRAERAARAYSSTSNPS
jgi:hypothetical protein